MTNRETKFGTFEGVAQDEDRGEWQKKWENEKRAGKKDTNTLSLSLLTRFVFLDACFQDIGLLVVFRKSELETSWFH